MNITKENVDKLNAMLRIQVEKPDYETKVENALRDYRRKAQIHGFRPGKVPMNMIKKMVGTRVLVEEVNKLVYESIYDYLKKENINIIGEPIFNEKEQQKIDWENQTEFNFVFDLGLSPEIKLEIGKKIKVPYYKILADDKIIDEYIDEYCRRFGKYITADTVEKDEMLRGDLVEINEQGEPVEGGISTTNSPFILSGIKDEEIKKKFIGAKLHDVIVFDPRKAFGNDMEIAALLGISKEAAEKLNITLRLTITEILKYEKAEINQDLFDKVFGAGTVSSIEEFRTKLKGQIEKGFEIESNYKFVLDLKEILLKEANLSLPVDFLKRWLLMVNNKITPEQVEKEFPLFEKDLQWQLIKNDLIRKNNISVTEEEVKDFARIFTLAQFRQYGMANFTDEQLDYFTNSILAREEDRKKMSERKLEEKVIEYIKQAITLDQKEISHDKFKTLLEKENK